MSATFDESWRARFGDRGPAEWDHLTPFLSRRSVRRFSTDPLPDGVLTVLQGAAQSAATSSNLQLWSAVRVTDPELRSSISKIAGMSHVASAPEFFVFLADLNRLSAVSDSSDNALDFAEFGIMAIVDAALAAERLACAAESVGLGVCYIGAVRNDVWRVKELLNLPERTVPLFGLTLGYPAQEPGHDIKPRLDQSSVWFDNTYPAQIDVQGYDDRMAAHFGSRGQDPAVTWSMRSARRVGMKALGSRDQIKQFLIKQKLFLR